MVVRTDSSGQRMWKRGWTEGKTVVVALAKAAEARNRPLPDCFFFFKYKNWGWRYLNRRTFFFTTKTQTFTLMFLITVHLLEKCVEIEGSLEREEDYAETSGVY